jgi:hypothetical protein
MRYKLTITRELDESEFPLSKIIEQMQAPLSDPVTQAEVLRFLQKGLTYLLFVDAKWRVEELNAGD